MDWWFVHILPINEGGMDICLRSCRTYGIANSENVKRILISVLRSLYSTVYKAFVFILRKRYSIDCKAGNVSVKKGLWSWSHFLEYPSVSLWSVGEVCPLCYTRFLALFLLVAVQRPSTFLLLSKLVWSDKKQKNITVADTIIDPQPYLWDFSYLLSSSISSFQFVPQLPVCSMF